MTTSITSESSVAIHFGDSIDLETHRKVLDVSDWLAAHPFPGLLSVVPTYTIVTVFFDPVLAKKHWPGEPSPARAVRAFLEEKMSQLQIGHRTSAISRTPIEIEVSYGGEYGPDLAEVAKRLQLPENEVIRLHTATLYTVFMIGFLPGFPYLGPLPEPLRLPRRDTPRLRVPAGSVAIAGSQTGIYPQASPGGWHLIGRTDVRLFDPGARPPAYLQPGMRVRFRQVPHLSR